MTTKRYRIRSTLTVPKEVIELDDGQTVASGTTIALPIDYGDHLVAERLAEPPAEDDEPPVEDGEPTDGNRSSDAALGEMTKAELIAEAESRQVAVPSDATKAEILSLLRGTVA